MLSHSYLPVPFVRRAQPPRTALPHGPARDAGQGSGLRPGVGGRAHQLSSLEVAVEHAFRLVHRPSSWTATARPPAGPSSRRAALTLPRHLHTRAARLLHHGDFDWGGLRTATAQLRRVPWRPWRYAAVATLTALAPLEGTP